MKTGSRRPKNNQTKHIKSPIRKQKVTKGRLIWNSTGGTFNERLHDFFKYCLEIADGYSKREMAFIIYGDKIKLDEKIGAKGQMLNLTAEDILRLLKFVKYTEQLFTKFRKWLENEGLILESEKTADGEIMFYNIMETTSIQELERKRKKMEESIRQVRLRENTIFKQGRRVRLKKMEVQSERQRRRKRRDDKKESGDYGDGVY